MVSQKSNAFGRSKTMRDVILWFAGVPIIVIIALHLTGLLH
jgi:hypothetical protein